MRGRLLNFTEFSQKFSLYEAKETSSSGTDCIIAAGNESEKKGQERFIVEASMMDHKELKNLLDSVLAKGSSLLAAFDNTWKERTKMGLDKGPLTRAGKWYIGEGAWRINSAKASHLGMTPSSIKYYDPMQQELLEKYFPEDYSASGVTVSSTGEIEGLEEPAVPKAKKELVASESLKYIKMYESDEEFSLGPPSSARNAVVVDANELQEQLIDNFFLKTRKNVMIWGAPGIGKTELVRSAAKVIGDRLGLKKPVEVKVVTMATKMKYDLQGLPLLFVKESDLADPDVAKRLVMPDTYRGKVGADFAYPAWLPPPDDESDAILFFDEINRADSEVLAACLTLLLDRKSGDYVLPWGWRIWAAGNRDCDGPVTKLEGAVASRFLGGHWHLVPTIESWSEWARSEHGFYKDEDGSTSEWYIPNEFLSFLKLRDVAQKEGKGGTITNLGQTFRVKFDYFYKWDSAQAAENAGGKMEGFPMPRNWSAAFGLIYEKIRGSEKMSMASNTVDPRMKTISVFGQAMLDPKFERDVTLKMASIVGTEATDAFLQYAKMLARYNDQDGLLTDKVENVFTNPEGPRPLIGKGKVSTDEAFGILTMVEGKFDQLVYNGKMGIAEFCSWEKYLLDLDEGGIVKSGDLASHISSCLNKSEDHRKAYKHVKSLDPKTGKPFATQAQIPIIKKFEERFRDIISQFNRL